MTDLTVPAARYSATGITVPRRFTTAGTHPYDEVTWERRDVVQTNWKTGEVVFEQRGAEFPDFWSLNASTIVTTKYFRGALGTEQRETSLRQVIDRVVTAYYQAGMEHGYFASADDAAAFRDELTWMLLHQAFSFNSPVWFNVGTEAPQQVSACFILSADDSMESILNWYREEGLIFKGGSGAGVNLSRLRSSRELLRSSGGSASGPVSFMRGADASAGTIKSGGATRRAAKMVVLDVDHPDIEEFVETKMREEEKIRVLRDAGFDMDLGGRDIVSVQYQNANNSVRVSDLFMSAVEEEGKFGLVARTSGDVVETVDAKALFRKIAEAAWACADPGIQYDDTINRWHTSANTGRINASNPCSEYMHLDNSSCNLASLNLMKFLNDDGTFNVDDFTHVVETVITAMEISIAFADFPTTAIGDTTRRFRQLGIGYSNLGALLMSVGLPYDSEEGRALSGAITSLMTAVSYRRSAELAAVVGPYAGYADNVDPHTRVIRQHAAAAVALHTPTVEAARISSAAIAEWNTSLDLGSVHGWRNAQASVLAPTGCLVEGSMVSTDHGLLRLGEIGDVYGDRWQDVSFQVATDGGPQQATKFFVNGEEETRRIVTQGGYVIQGTNAHRVKVVDPATGEWVWKRFGDIAPSDLVPMQTGMVGEPKSVSLPPLEEPYHNDTTPLVVPTHMNADLAELLGYFMGDGDLAPKAIRLTVCNEDLDLIEHLRLLVKRLFHLDVGVTEYSGHSIVHIRSARLARWWDAAGFRKFRPTADHFGKGWTAHIPHAVRASNDPEVYGAFLRGLFEADGNVTNYSPILGTASEVLVGDVRSMLLALGIASSTYASESRSGNGNPFYAVRVRNGFHSNAFEERVNFLSVRKRSNLPVELVQQSYKNDRIHLPEAVWRELADGTRIREAVLMAVRRGSGVSRKTATDLLVERWDPRLAHALGYIYETVVANEDGGIQPTYDISVPSNVTYVANGFVSHNTISFMMDCDTTGVEPDFSLVKFKKMVGGGSLQIVNQQVPRALATLGYTPEVIELISAHILEHGNVIDAPGLKPEHYPVFDTAMGERAITWEGHVLMMAAVQPFLSGAISKTVNLPETATVEDIEDVYFQGWKLGLKAVAVYRDNCKVGQPLSDAKAKATDVEPTDAPAEPEVVYVEVPKRTRLPRKRRSSTVSFDVQGTEGYMTTGEYDDGRLGEVFIKMSKQGSTLSGLMDAFSIAVSIGLQYGVPLESFVSKFIGTRFEPAGVTDDQDVRLAQSIVDYVFRRLALDYLPLETREVLGILSAQERIAALDATHGTPTQVPTSAAVSTPAAPKAPAVAVHAGLKVEAPMCSTCGHNTAMTKTGGCWACRDCGSTTGCS